MVGEKKFKKFIWIGIAIFVIVTALLGFQLRNLRFDYNFENFFPLHDEETAYFFEYRDQFKSDNDFLLISVESKKGVFNEKFLKQVSDFERNLRSVKHVDYVRSITSEEEMFIFPGGTSSSKPYINFDDFNPIKDSTRIFKNDELINTFVSENGKALCLFIKHEDFLSKKKGDKLVEEVKKYASQSGLEDIRIAGRTIGQAYYINKMVFELTLFLGLSAFLIILFLYIAFRSIWGILIPQVVIVFSLLWVLGGMGLFDEPINIILTVLPSIMLVVCMSDVVHLVSRYLDALREESDVFTAIKIAVKEVGLATLLTSITTSIGFFSLYFVRVQPIQVFGIIMGFGVLIAFVLTFLTLPILFYVFPGPKHIRKNKKGHFWKKHLENGFIYIIRKRRGVLVASLVVLLVSVYGLFQIETNNFMMDDLKESEAMKQDFNFFDENFGGIRPYELSIELKDTTKSVWDKEVLQTLDTVETYLEEVYGVTVKNSLIKVLKTFNRSAHAGNPDEYKIPTSNRKIRSYRRMIRVIDRGQFVYSFLDSSGLKTRVSGTISDLGNKVVTKKSEKLMTFLEGHNLNGAIEYKITGTAYLLDKNMRYLAVSLVKGLGISIFLVAIIIGAIYRSTRILLISIVTNVFPLLVIAGVMGYFGIELKTSTSIVFTIAFGIAVDDTIHFLGKFKHELMKGKGKMYALKRSYSTTGKAMILTTLILSAGFLLLIFSSFLGTFYMGLLLCITFVVALVADLTLLPILLLIFYKDKNDKKALN